MEESIVGDESWNEMTEAEKTKVVRDGPEQLRNACRYILIHTGTNLEELPVRSNDEKTGDSTKAGGGLPVRQTPARHEQRKSSVTPNQKPRFGLPDGFIPRFHRYGRLALLEENIYSLPDGKEFVPCRPTGTLGSGRHLYALLTIEQFGRGERGSVFVRLDGRVFDYSTDSVDPDLELFDTGFTIHDLERTGRYASPFLAPRRRVRRKRREKNKRAKAVKA
jgi:hypothetical protein